MRAPKFPITFVAILAALLLAFPAVGLAGEKGDQEQEHPTEEHQEEQETERERQKEVSEQREQREQQMREEKAQQRERQPAAQMGQTAQVTLTVRSASAEELTSQPQQYFGELVQVKAQVEQKHGKKLLTLQPAQATAQEREVRTDVPGRVHTAENLLVIIPREAEADIPENETLEIVGHVRPLVWTEFERDYAWFDMDLFQEFQSEMEQAGTVRTDQPEMPQETRPVLIATSIKSEDGKELLKHQGN